MRITATLSGVALLAMSQTSAAQVPPGYLPISIAADRLGLVVEVRTVARPDVEWQKCSAPCTLYVPPGDYYFVVKATEDTVEGRRRVHVDAPQTLTFEPRSRTTRFVGLLLGASGTALCVAGILGGFSNYFDSFDYDEDPNREELRAEARTRSKRWFIGAGIGGAVVGTVGWILFIPTRPSMTSEPSVKPTVSVTPLPGAGFALHASFTF